eukprot:8616817-Heterocapsa_arctica.AAC.1
MRQGGRAEQSQAVVQERGGGCHGSMGRHETEGHGTEGSHGKQSRKDGRTGSRELRSLPHRMRPQRLC